MMGSVGRFHAGGAFFENGKNLNDLGRAITFAHRRRHDWHEESRPRRGGTGVCAKTGTCSWGRAVPAYYLGGAGCLTRSSSRLTGLPSWRPRFIGKFHPFLGESEPRSLTDLVHSRICPSPALLCGQAVVCCKVLHLGDHADDAKPRQSPWCRERPARGSRGAIA